MFSGHRSLIFIGALAIAAAGLYATADEANAVGSLRDYKCMTRADRYANEPHPGVPAQELADRIAWLYSQCEENREAEAVAEEQGSMAEKLFPNTSNDRHAHPLHCMSFTDSRFGMHTEHDSPNPPDDLNGPGGSATVNITGEFMYAWIDGKARFLVRYVVWTVDDRDGNPLTPVKITQHPTYMGTPQTTVALVDFAEAYEPVSIWVEMPDTMALANRESDILEGRRLTVRTWMESHCHDKRDPTVIPQLLIDRVSDLGWRRSNATPREPRALRFVANGNPNQASSWSISEVPVKVPSQVNAKGGYRWFYDSELVYNKADQQAPTKPADLQVAARWARKIRLEWGASSDNFEVAGYIVYRDGKRVGFTTNRWFVDKGLWPQTSYRYKVVAIDTSGNRSVRSRIVNPTTKADTSPPTKPRNVTVAKTKNTITLRWDPASDNVGISHYVVKLDGEKVANTTGSSFTFTGLRRNTRYHVAIRAVDVFDNLGKMVHRYPTTKR